MDPTIAAATASFLRRLEPALRDAALAARELAATLDVVSERTDEPQQGAAAVPAARGPRQQDIVNVLMKSDGDEGLKTGEIAKQVTMDQPNAYLTLQSLQKQEIVEMVPGVQPQHWRLAPKYRLSRRIVETANLVEPGEWTGYGEIGQVVYGHGQAGQAVARVVSRLDDVEHPHRVLEHDGHIPDGWVDGQGHGPEECSRRLVAEGVEVSDDSYAHGRHRVEYEELIRRLKRYR